MDEFVRAFKPLLTSRVPLRTGQFDRWPAFEFIGKKLLAKGAPVNIVETGSLRTTNDWLGYGQATMVFDWILGQTGGSGHSVDIDLTTCHHARRNVKHMRVVHADSIGFLRGFGFETLDLLYLDAYDWSPALKVESALHHMGELACIFNRLSTGCMIAVDDCHSEAEGKHVLVRDFFKSMFGKDPVVKSHVQVWVK